MNDQEQLKMLAILEQQKLHQQQVDRVLKVVLPVVAFLLAMICANFNMLSTLGTIVMMTVAFWMVGIRRKLVWHWATIVIVYCLIDNLYSYQGSFNFDAFGRQCGTTLVFLWIIGIGRPYIDRWLMKSDATPRK